MVHCGTVLHEEYPNVVQQAYYWFMSQKQINTIL